LTSRPSSIALVAGQLGLGGAERQLYLFVRGLLESGHRPRVLTLNPDRRDFWEGPLADMSVPVVPIPRGPRAWRVLRAAAALRAGAFDLVHGWGLHANPCASLGGRLAGVPCRLGSVREHPDHWPRSPLLRLAGLAGLDGIVVNSRATAAAVRRRAGLGSASVHIVPNGVELPDLSARPVVRDRVARAWGLDARAVWIAAVGRHDANKSWDVLIDACSELARAGRAFQVLFMGSGPATGGLEARARRLGLERPVRFAGQVPGARDCLVAFDLLALPSRTEGMPNTVMEAAAAGLPVVASEVGALPELVDDGGTGFLVRYGETAALAARLDELCADAAMRLRMGRAAREKMRVEYAPAATIAGILSVYERVWSRRGGGTLPTAPALVPAGPSGPELTPPGLPRTIRRDA
jgi:glycosyltransferase involved in cell wall biosynthesis